MNPSTQPVAAVVVAAGSGSRLGADVPKALVELHGRALVRHSVDALAAGGVERIVVTVPQRHLSEFEQVLAGVGVPLVQVVGGERRQDSVRRGLDALADLPADAVVLIHDAARPLVPPDVVRGVIGAVHEGASAVIPVVPVADSIRAVTGDTSQVVERDGLRAVQTPQGFRFQTVVASHREIEATGVDVTDDASACQACGHPVMLVPGHRNAFKITEPIDLILAEALLGKGMS